MMKWMRGLLGLCWLVLLSGSALAAEPGKVEGKLIVDGKELKLNSVVSFLKEDFGKKYTTVVLTEKPVPAKAVQEDKLYQLAYSKEIQGIRLRFDDQGKFIGVIVYHPAFDGPSTEYQGFADFTKTRFDASVIQGKVSMDHQDFGEHSIHLEATFSAPVPKP